VSLRRLRALLALCDQALDWKTGRRLRRQARDLGRIVSTLRDADVLVEDIARPALGGAGNASALLQTLEAHRAQTRAATRRALCEAGATAFALRLLEAAELRSWQPRKKKQRRRLEAPLLPTLEPVLDRAWKKVCRRGHRLARLSAEKRHRLRKDLKQLRYLAEIATLAADAPDSRRFFRRLERLQDDLGLLNDLVTVEQRQLSADDAATRESVASVRMQLQASPALDAQTALARAARHWRKLHKTGPFWRSGK
jgi:CHAD domain-containing protein